MKYLFEKISIIGGDHYSKVGVVIADNKNPDSIREMCRQTKVVVNCVGPVGKTA